MAGAVALPVRATDLPVIIDAHTHFYDPTRPQGVPWPNVGSPLYRTVLPPDWKAVAAPHGVTHTIVVEASNWLEDNQWMLELAAREPAIVGFVGNIPPMTPDFAASLRHFAANPTFLGIRISGKTLQTEMLKPEFFTAMRLLAELDLAMDVVGGPDMLPAVAQLADDLPDLRIIIDHVGGSGPPDKLSDAWKDGMKKAAKGRGVYCKVSAVPEQCGNREWGTAPQDTAYYLPILDHVWECFGEERVIYGSNWPVSDRATHYGVVFQMVREYFAARGAGVLARYFKENSMAAYRWMAR